MGAGGRRFGACAAARQPRRAVFARVGNTVPAPEASCAVAVPATRSPEIELPDHRQWPTLNAALATLAAEAPRGHVPRAFLSEQNY